MAFIFDKGLSINKDRLILGEGQNTPKNRWSKQNSFHAFEAEVIKKQSEPYTEQKKNYFENIKQIFRETEQPKTVKNVSL